MHISWIILDTWEASLEGPGHEKVSHEEMDGVHPRADHSWEQGSGGKGDEVEKEQMSPEAILRVDATGLVAG